MPLEVGDLRAGDEDVLAGTGRRLLLLDLELHHHRRVLDNLVNVRPVTRADFPKDTLEDPNDTAEEPVSPEDTDGVERALRASRVGFCGLTSSVESPVIRIEHTH